MSALQESVNQVRTAPEIHQRLAAIEQLFRWLEERILKEENDNSVHLQEQVQKLEEYTFEHLDLLYKEQAPLQNSVVSTSMLLFTLLCRFELYRHEPSWRNTDTHVKLQEVIQAPVLPSHADPILFWSQQTILEMTTAVQQHWYTHYWNIDTVSEFLKWLERRLSLLITFPFDGDTMNVQQYRQKHADGFMTNIHFIWDMHAFFLEAYRDCRTCRHIMETTELVPPNDMDGTKTRSFLLHTLTNIQGDSLINIYQQHYVEAHVRLGHRWIFRRRRPDVLSPRDMDIIQECCGREYSQLVHHETEKRLIEFMEDPSLKVQDVLLMVVQDYFAMQTVHFPFLSSSVVHRFRSCATAAVNDRPMITFLPVRNLWTVLQGNHRWEMESFQEATIQWMRRVREDHGDTLVLNGKKYRLQSWFDECI
jgi:hypothetical protein